MGNISTRRLRGQTFTEADRSLYRSQGYKPITVRPPRSSPVRTGISMRNGVFASFNIDCKALSCLSSP